MKIDPHVDQAIVHALTVADRRQKSNPYALAHYLGAYQAVREDVATGQPLRAALMDRFCGPIVARLVKAAGLPPLTDEEIRQVR